MHGIHFGGLLIASYGASGAILLISTALALKIIYHLLQSHLHVYVFAISFPTSRQVAFKHPLSFS